jgi:hypothetical protein
MSNDGHAGSFVAELLRLLDEQRAEHPGERVDCIGLHPAVFDMVYLHVHGSLTPDRSGVSAMRRVGDDYETVWLHPDPEITDLTEVLFGRLRME